MTTTPPHPLAVLRRTWWVALLVLLLSLATAHVLTRRTTPVYRAASTVVVIPNGAVVTSVREIIDSLDTLDRRTVVATLARLAHSQPVVAAAAEKAGMPREVSRQHRVRTIVLPNTNIIDIEVTGPDPEACATLANGVAQSASSEAIQLYQTFRMRLLDEAVPSRRPIRPDVQRNLTVAAVLGALGGLALAAAIEWARRAAAASREAPAPPAQ
jgi:uncharacterized protein involved in exopolysaccharide biosynthesis